MCVWSCSAYSNVLHPDGKWDDGKARMRKQLMILQIANCKANVSTNDISKTRQWSTCQSQLPGMGEEETKIKSKYTAHKHKYKYMIVLQKHSCFQISHRYTLLPSCLPWPNLTQHERDHRPPTVLEEEMGSLLIGLKRKLPRTLILNSVGNKLFGNMFQSSGSLGESCLDQD